MIRIGMIVVLCISSSAFVRAGSALELISGFDAERVASTYPAKAPESMAELAKLLYRVKKVDDEALLQRVGEAESFSIGDAIEVEGTVDMLKRARVPERIAGFMEFDSFFHIAITSSKTESSVQVIAPVIKGAVAVGDRVGGVGIVIADQAGAPKAVALKRLKWFPNKTTSSGWRLLSQQGVDVSLLADVSTRHRQPLTSADGDAFYSMLAAAKKIGGNSAVLPEKVAPLSLLREPQKFGGHWLRMRVNTVRITRVRITDARRQQQLGSDHYFQLDASGDLGNTVILLEDKESGGDPIRFESFYPVSVAMLELPSFLSELATQQEGENWVTAMVSEPVLLDGFFFRLWSYSSDFVKRQGQDKQFGPLVIAARLQDKRMDSESSGVEWIGYIAAFSIVTGILGITIWSRVTGKGDDEVRKKRQDREAQDLSLPSDLDPS